MSKPTPPLAERELDDLLIRAIAQAPDGLTGARVRGALPKACRPPAPETLDRLHALADRGLVHRWPGRPERFASRPVRDVVRAQVLAEFDTVAAPRTAARIGRSVVRAGRSVLPGVLATLVEERRLYVHPPVSGRTPAYGPVPPDPKDYLASDLSKLIAKVTRKGFPAERVRDAIQRALGGERKPSDPGPPSAAAGYAGEVAILDGMAQLNPQVRDGALVYIPHLRRLLSETFPDKGSFDRSVLSLLARGRVELQTHPVVSEVAPAERDAMVEDGTGGFFMAIALKQG